MKKEEQEQKKLKKKKSKKSKGKKTTALMSTKDSEDDEENWECALCVDDDGEATDYVGCGRCECWFHFACTQLVNKSTDFVCDFCC